MAFGSSGHPLVTVTSLDGVPDEIEAQAPLDGELLRVIPGPDRPDYCLVILDRPLAFHPEPDRELVWIRAVVVVARFADGQLTPGGRGLVVDLALVLDDTTLRDEVLDFAMVLPVGVGTLSHRDAPPPTPPPPPALSIRTCTPSSCASPRRCATTSKRPAVCASTGSTCQSSSTTAGEWTR